MIASRLNLDLLCRLGHAGGRDGPAHTDGYADGAVRPAVWNVGGDDGGDDAADLSVLNVGLLVDIPGRMGEGNWRIAA